MVPTDDEFTEAILGLLARRGPGRTICPSDAARELAGDRQFRPLMAAVRAAAARLAEEQRVVITQRGQPVEALTARGPIRIGLPAP
ncbi:MAG: DUF3253 domain-containing protein [Solirubrobacteraceae bacterium]